MIVHEKPDRKGEVGATKGKEIIGRVDFIVPEGRGTEHVWSINDGNTIAIALTANQYDKHPELLVVSIPRTQAKALLASLQEELAR